MAECLSGCTIKNEHLSACEGNCWGCLPVHADFLVCEHCSRMFEKNLGRIRGAWGDLAEGVKRPTPISLKQRISGTPEVGLVINEQVVDLMTEAKDWVLFLIRIVNEDKRNSAIAGFGNPEKWLAVLEHHVPFLMRHELAPDLVRDVRQLARKVESAAYPSQIRLVKIRKSVCEREVAGTKCGGQLTYWIKEGAGPQLVRCQLDPSHNIPALEMSSATWIRADEVALAMGKKIGNVSLIAHRYKWPRIKVAANTFYARISVKEYLERNK